MKSLDCNQIKIFINLKITGEKDKYKKLCHLVQPLGPTTASKPNKKIYGGHKLGFNVEQHLNGSTKSTIKL